MHLKYNNVNENYSQGVCLSVLLGESHAPLWWRQRYDEPPSSQYRRFHSSTPSANVESTRAVASVESPSRY
jgi:hypothetical protein